MKPKKNLEQYYPIFPKLLFKDYVILYMVKYFVSYKSNLLLIDLFNGPMSIFNQYSAVFFSLKKIS